MSAQSSTLIRYLVVIVVIGLGGCSSGVSPSPPRSPVEELTGPVGGAVVGGVMGGIVGVVEEAKARRQQRELSQQLEQFDQVGVAFYAPPSLSQAGGWFTSTEQDATARNALFESWRATLGQVNTATLAWAPSQAVAACAIKLTQADKTAGFVTIPTVYVRALGYKEVAIPSHKFAIPSVGEFLRQRSANPHWIPHERITVSATSVNSDH